MPESTLDQTVVTAQPENKPVVLVIDDSRLVRVSICRTLASEFTIIEAVDGIDGLEKLHAEPKIQAVITDAGMPRLDGYGLITRIREDSNSRIKDIPIMMITGAEAGETAVMERAFKLGATDFITKPFDKTQMLARVRGYTKLDQTQRTLEDTEEALAEQSVIDTDTGINNRRYFLERGEQNLAFVKRHNQPLSVIAISIDGFSKIKDDYGDSIANQTLAWAAELVSDIKRKEDVVARVDDHCFAIIAPSATRTAATVLCERVRKHFNESTFTEATHSLSITVSLGMACLGNDDGNTITELLELAEKHVQQAQQAGGNQAVASRKKQGFDDTAIPAPSLDVALAQIRTGHADKLQPFLKILAKQVIPVLELCNKKLDWNVDEHIAAIREKLGH